ncbi:MAG: response regulator transcription factor [candidate division KSB1 bacterium]|nr:response regulator transcription factor [candidate division KSB1 bacterium]MDZ7300447.1 response regulator transcription factor [candidate division KSB1 bacterium]MDZ7309338.1 response regulator transcription factor [candidate division KSB1 bacterium]MDZ7351451.1 response regulator transcription factor [candidate division KSB1 bacterium]MDZ7355810.1 response regulator transcription factor [candidate division KSB1 bacterium]
MRVLIVEDEARVAQFIRKGLNEADYVADIAADAHQAEYLASLNEYDLILLDWLIPGASGVELCRQWRERGMLTPIIMLTVKDNTTDLITALDNGADDYLTKPFSFAELLARMRAQLRRTSSAPLVPLLKLDDLVVDPSKREVQRGGNKIFCSSREYALLEYLLRNAGNVVTRTAIAEHVWGLLFETNTNLIEVYINHLRKKLDCGSRRPLIHTVRNIGYVMKVLEIDQKAAR